MSTFLLKKSDFNIILFLKGFLNVYVYMTKDAGQKWYRDEKEIAWIYKIIPKNVRRTQQNYIILLKQTEK